MSDRNEPVSEKSSKSKGDVAGANGASVSASANNNSNKPTDQESLKDKKQQSKKPKSEKRRKNQMPSKKRSGGNGFVLSKEDIYYLKTHTRYDEKEIK